MGTFEVIAKIILCLFLVITFCNKIGSPHKKQSTTIVEVEGNFNAKIRLRLAPKKAAEDNAHSCGNIHQVSNFMKALYDSKTHTIGVCGTKYMIHALLQNAYRRDDRDKVFNRVLRADVTKKPDVKRIQEQLAGQLGFTFNDKSESKRASKLLDRIKNDHKILIILCHLNKGLDLGKKRIPFGKIHRGCKILLTYESEEVLPKYMPP